MNIIKLARILGILGFVCVLIFGLSYGSYALSNYFAPKYVATDNRVFHESQQYVDGMNNRLDDYHTQYIMASAPSEKDAIRGMVQVEFRSVHPEILTDQNRAFLDSVRGEQ